MSRKTVFIISQDEPFYIPKTIRYVLENQHSFEVIGATCLKPHRKNKSMKSWLLERTKIYTYGELFIVLRAMLTIKFLKRNKPWYSVRKLYEHFGIHHVETENINDDAYLDQIEALKPDYIISISPPQLFEERLLSIAKNHCLNAHGTLLPSHRGVFGSWWMIYEGDKESGATIHTMELRLDAGEIVFQEAFEVLKADTQYSLASKTKAMLVKGIVKIMDNELEFFPTTYPESYHKAPTKEQGKDFHQKGNKIITRANRKLVLAEKFSFE
ncbi:MAG: hypothetical protein JKY54_18740 [Flavobacteriales bacterium]|nr:hypothetical protein [Flavobacteriales bacterium]